MTPELMGAFEEKVKALREDDTVRCVVLAGSGRFFCGGANLRAKEFAKGGSATAPAAERSMAIYEPFLSVLKLEVPVIGALTGHAVGGG